MDDIFLIFSRKQVLTFHANCLHWKIRKIFQYVICWKVYPECKVLKLMTSIYLLKLFIISTYPYDVYSGKATISKNIRPCAPSKDHSCIKVMCEVWSECSLGTFWIPKDAKFIHINNKNWSNCADAWDLFEYLLCADVGRYIFSCCDSKHIYSFSSYYENKIKLWTCFLYLQDTSIISEQPKIG